LKSELADNGDEAMKRRHGKHAFHCLFVLNGRREKAFNAFKGSFLRSKELFSPLSPFERDDSLKLLSPLFSALPAFS